MHISISLPASVIGPLRQGAYAALRSPLDEIAEALIGKDSSSDPTPSADSLRRLLRARHLLNTLGWSEGEALEETLIDLSEHAGALTEALDNALKAALKRLDRLDRGLSKQAHQEMYALSGFAAVINKADLECSQRDPHVQAFYESAEQLLAQLDAEEANYA